MNSPFTEHASVRLGWSDVGVEIRKYKAKWSYSVLHIKWTPTLQPVSNRY